MAVKFPWRKDARSLKTKTLKILRINRGLVRSSNTQTEENIHLNIPEDHNIWKTTELALLEAERKKAEAFIHGYSVIK